MIRLVFALLFMPFCAFGQTVMQIEQSLTTLGYNVGVLDGLADANTQQAVMQYQYDFGFPVTGQLQHGELKTLQSAAQFSQSTTPFIVVEDRPQTEDPDRAFSAPFKRYPRTIYANGMHYQQTRGLNQYNEANRTLPSNFNARSFDTNTNIRLGKEKSALAMAQETQDPFDDAVIFLTSYRAKLNSHEDPAWIKAKIDALELVMAQAQANPAETAFIHLLSEGLSRFLQTHTICKIPSNRTALEPVVLKIARLIDRSQTQAQYKGNGLSSALQCINPEHEDEIHQMLVRTATAVSPNLRAGRLQSRALAADKRGDTAIAKEVYTEIFPLLNQNAPVTYSAPNQYGVTRGSAQDITAMHRAGMPAEARALAQTLLQTAEQYGTAAKDGSRAEAGGFLYNNVWLAAALIESGNFDLLRRHGLFYTEGADEWGSAISAIRINTRDGNTPLTLKLAAIALREILKDGASPTALEISLIEAEVAAETGSFDTAESAIVRAATLAQTLDAYPEVETRITAVRNAIETEIARQSGPAELLISQIENYYGNDCNIVPQGQVRSRYWTVLDLEPFLTDPDVRARLIEAKVLDRILSCNPKKVTGFQELRLMCGLAAASGRTDVLQRFYETTFTANSTWEIESYGKICILAIASVGQKAILHQIAPVIVQTKQLQDIALAFVDTPTRTALLAQAAASQSEDTKPLWQRDLRTLELPSQPTERRATLNSIRQSYQGSFGNMGVQAEDESRTFEDVHGYSALGLHGIAEAHLFAMAKINSLQFGTETPDAITTQMLDPVATAQRLAFARLYHAAGRMDDANRALSPLVKLAVNRLSSDTDPLPGTSEQWAKRLRAVFSLYLQLQFEPLSSGADYPTLFLVQQYLQLAQSTASSSVLAQRLNSAAPEITREYQDTQRALRKALDNAGDGSLEISELNQRLQAIEARLPKSDAALQSHQIGVIRDLKSAVRALREDNAAMVIMTQLRDALIISYLDGTSVTARKLGLDVTEAAQEVTAFRSSIIDSTDANDRFDPQTANRLYASLIGWGHAGKELPADFRLVVDGPLATLPFAALRNGEDWLGAMVQLRQSPSVARAVKSAASSEAQAGFVGFGDPNLTEGDVATRRTLLGSDLYLAELPETAKELAFMALAFGGNPTNDVFTRNRASERQIHDLNASGKLADTGILALATHGLLSSETGQVGSAGLILSLPEGPNFDGILTAAEIYNYKLGADIVILSACNTGTPGAGQGLSDLASAFLYSGAEALMLTHWEIDSGAAVEMVKWVATHQRTSKGTPYTVSLQHAVKSILGDASLSQYHHPRFWASHFILS